MFHFLRSLLPDSRIGLRHVFGLGVLMVLCAFPASWAIRTTLAVRELQSAGCHVEPIFTWIDRWTGKLSTPIRVMIGGVDSVKVDGKRLPDSVTLNRLIDSVIVLNPVNELQLSDVQLTDQQMKRLCSEIRVESLSFLACQLGESPLEGLGDNSALRHLLLSNSIRSGTQLQGLGKCLPLESLGLLNCAMIDGELQELGNCASLKILHIHSCSFPTEVELPEIRNLLYLNLADTNLKCDVLRRSSPYVNFTFQ